MADASPRLGLPAPADTDPADIPLDVDRLRDALDPVAVVFRQGLASAMPAAGVPGRIYFATDVLALYYDDGAVWHSSLGAATGDIKPSGSGVTPPGWLLCNGAQYARSDYPILFNTIGLGFTATDDGATFNVPDLRGRAPIGAGQGGGLTNRTLGQNGGEENHALSVTEIPSHNHGGATGGGTTGTDSPDHAHGGATAGATARHTHSTGRNLNLSVAAGPYAYTFVCQPLAEARTDGDSPDHAHNFTSYGANARHAHSVPALGIAAQGGSGGHNNMPPYAAVNWYIKT